MVMLVKLYVQSILIGGHCYRNGELWDVYCLAFHTVLVIRPGHVDFFCWFLVSREHRRLGLHLETGKDADRAQQAGLGFVCGTWHRQLGRAQAV